jgi:hypothetical protein
MKMACSEQKVNTAPAVSSAPRKRRRHISAETWSAVAAFMSRERSRLAEVAPNSVRIRPPLARVVWLEREPSMAAIEIHEAA